MTARIVAARLTDLGPLDVHALYKLRVDVFVAEQDCPYAEIDEIDADPGTVHLLAWVGDPAGGEDLAATLRVFESQARDGVQHIGRLCTAPAHRGTGLGARLLGEAIERCAGSPIEIGAQSHLEGWYERFGFVRCGDEFLDERIPHLPMRRD